jgi:hypothetical protein
LYEVWGGDGVGEEVGVGVALRKRTSKDMALMLEE